MENLDGQLTSILAIGIGATAVMDLWSWLRKRLIGLDPPNYCMVGRWFGHMPRGTFHHQSIAKSQPVRGECLVGWIAHYLIGVGYAGIVVGIWGPSWVQDPTIIPALVVAAATLVAPFLIMQPGMGAGIASSKTPRPNFARVQSVITHMVFGLGMYLAARLLSLSGYV